MASYIPIFFDYLEQHYEFIRTMSTNHLIRLKFIRKILRIWSNYDLYQLDIYDNDLRYHWPKRPGHTWWNLNFERMVHDGYDGMEVIISTNDIYYALYGWDCDSLLVFNPDIMIF